MHETPLDTPHHHAALDWARRLSALLLMTSGFFLGACKQENPNQVVLYSSVDDQLLAQIVEAYEQRTGVDVLVAGDTEATKTTGLVQRLLAERDNPKADVWWSSEPFGTIRLSEAGALERYEPAPVRIGWPEGLRGANLDWYGFAPRERVIVYSPNRVQPEHVSHDLAEMGAHNAIGIARPAFGTTRGHMGILLSAWGEEKFSAWLQDLRSTNVRLYDGNATVVRAIHLGEIDAGLTDTDDVFAGQRNGWDVVMTPAKLNGDPVLLPNTVALVKGAPNPAQAMRLIDFLISPEVERMIAESESRNVPVHAEVRRALGITTPLPQVWIDFEEVAPAIPEALELCDQHLQGP